MRQNHPSFEQLSELVDGDLTPDVAHALERHLAACDACRIKLSRLRGIIHRAAGLATSIEPPADAWRSVRARLRTPASRATPHTLWLRRWGLRAAAALVLVAGSSAVTVLVLRGGASMGEVAAVKQPP